MLFTENRVWPAVSSGRRVVVELSTTNRRSTIIMATPNGPNSPPRLVKEGLVFKRG